MTQPSNDRPADDLEGLLSDLFEQGLTDERWQDLRQILRDPLQRRRYRRYVRIHALLETELLLPLQLPSAGVAAQLSMAASPLSRETVRVSAPAGTTIRSLGPSRWLRAAAAVFVAAAGALAWMLLRTQPTEADVFAIISTIEHMPDAPWRTGTLLGKGPLMVPAGIVHVVFDSGVAVTVQGPARMALTSPQGMTLDSGALVAHVPAHAVGFHVSTAQAQLVDLGTEFGVAATPSGHTTVQVREGRVAVTTAMASDPTVLAAGEARRIEQAGRVSVAAVNASLFSFAPITDTAASRWQEARSRLLQDPDLIAWYDATGLNDGDAQVPNRAPAQIAGNGQLAGPTLTAGRIPGSRAWHFQAPGDRIRITVPGRYHAMTLLAWVRFDRFGRESTALLTTDGWGNPPLFQWQCQPNGVMTLALCSNTSRIWSWHADQPLSQATGTWHLLGCTVETNGTVRFYGDGILLGENRHHIILDTLIGSALIGDWASYNHDQAQPPSNRQLQGLLDGFGILSRAMTGGELAELAAAGNR
jgi:hypothetical protein